MKYLSVIILVFVTILAVYFFMFSEITENNGYQKIVVATSADNPPFSFINTQEGGALQGFEIDLMQAIAEKMGVSLEIRDMDFPSIIASLQSGRVDMGIAGFEKTPERSQNVDFSFPYHEAQRFLLSLSPIQGPPPEWAGKKIGAQLGTAHEAFLKDIQKKYPSLQIASYNRIGEMIQDLKNKRIDWALVDRSLGKTLAQKEFFYPFEVAVSGDIYVIAFPKNSSLRDKVNHALDQLEKEGVIDELTLKWLEE